MRRFANPRQLVLAALFLALGIALSIFEGMLPLLMPFAGVKVGLANIALLLCLELFPLRLTIAVFFLRLLLSSLLLGNFLSASFFIGGAGGFLSLMAMLAARKLPEVSLAGVSIAGAAAHNAGQILMASFLINNYIFLSYLPIVLLLSIPLGIFTGLVARAGLSLYCLNRP